MAIRYFPVSPVGPVVSNDPSVLISEGSAYTDIVSVATLYLSNETIYKYWISESSGITEEKPGVMNVRLSGSTGGPFTVFKTLRFPVNPSSSGTFRIPEIASYSSLKISAKVFSPSPLVSDVWVRVNAGISPL